MCGYLCGLTEPADGSVNLTYIAEYKKSLTVRSCVKQKYARHVFLIE